MRAFCPSDAVTPVFVDERGNAFEGYFCDCGLPPRPHPALRSLNGSTFFLTEFPARPANAAARALLKLVSIRYRRRFPVEV